MALSPNTRPKLRGYGFFAVFAVGVALLVTLLFPFYGGVRTQAQQIQDEYTCPASQEEVEDLFQLDATHAWILFEDHALTRHYMLRTINGGANWTASRAPQGIRRLYFVNANLGWALRYGDKQSGWFLLKSTNGGKSWRQLSPRPMVEPSANGSWPIVGLVFTDPRHGWFVTSAPSHVAVYQTLDGGRTIQKSSEIQGIGNCAGIYVEREAGIWIFGQGFALHSEDGGRTWKNPIDLEKLGINQNAFSIESARFFDDGRGLLIGEVPYAIILSSYDFGRHWHIAQESERAGGFESITFWDNNQGCVAGFSTLLTCTNDGGATWNSEAALPAARYLQCTNFRKLVLLGSGRGWAVRDGGYLFETSDRGKTWHEFNLLSKIDKKQRVVADGVHFLRGEGDCRVLGFAVFTLRR